jgi:hypothetical protein
LLASQHDAGVLAARVHPTPVQQTEVSNVEAVQYAPFAGSVPQLVFVASADHVAIQSGRNFNMPRT